MDSDIRELARVISESAETAKLPPGSMLIMGTVMSVEGDSCTVDVMDSGTEQPGIYFLKNSYYPVIGEKVWLAKNGDNYFIIGKTGVGPGWHTYGSWIGHNGWYEGAGGSINCVYRMVGGECHLRFRVEFSGTIIAPAESLTLRLPFQAADLGFEQVGVAYYDDASVPKRYHGQCTIIDSASPQYLYFSHEDAPYGVVNGSPFNWASGDSFGGYIAYEISTPTPEEES